MFDGAAATADDERLWSRDLSAGRGRVPFDARGRTMSGETDID